MSVPKWHEVSKWHIPSVCVEGVEAPPKKGRRDRCPQALIPHPIGGEAPTPQLRQQRPSITRWCLSHTESCLLVIGLWGSRLQPRTDVMSTWAPRQPRSAPTQAPGDPPVPVAPQRLFALLRIPPHVIVDIPRRRFVSVTWGVYA